MLVDGELQGRNRFGVAAEGEQRLEPVLDRLRPLLLEAHDDRSHLLVGPDTGERRPAPQGERGVEVLERLGGVPGGGRAAGLVDDRREAVHVDRVRRQAQDVAGRLRHQHLGRGARLARRFDGAAQARHVALERAQRGARRFVAPQPVDQAFDRHDPADVDREVGDHGALLRATEVDRDAVAVHLNRAEHVHREHRRCLPQRPHYEPHGSERSCKPVVRGSQVRAAHDRGMTLLPHVPATRSEAIGHAQGRPDRDPAGARRPHATTTSGGPARRRGRARP